VFDVARGERPAQRGQQHRMIRRRVRVGQEPFQLLDGERGVVLGVVALQGRRHPDLAPARPWTVGVL
jgi:hypothetical protein